MTKVNRDIPIITLNLKKVKSFDSNILNGFSGSKGVKGLKK